MQFFIYIYIWVQQEKKATVSCLCCAISPAQTSRVIHLLWSLNTPIWGGVLQCASRELSSICAKPHFLRRFCALFALPGEGGGEKERIERWKEIQRKSSRNAIIFVHSWNIKGFSVMVISLRRIKFIQQWIRHSWDLTQWLLKLIIFSHASC